MDGSLSVFAPAYAYIDSLLGRFVDDSAGRAAAAAAGPLRAALVLYVILYGFAILRGAIAEPFIDFAVRSVKLAFIVLLVTGAGYSEWVSRPLFEAMPAAIAQAVAGETASDAGEAFDQFLGRTGYLADKVAKKANALDWLPWLVSGAVLVIGALAAALGFGIVTLAKVALALLVALGPIFIACALFEATRRWFFGWLSQAVNYLVLFALIIAIFELVLALVGERWATIDGQDPVVGGLIFIALCLLGAIFFLQTPAIAAGIAGGASIGLADFGSALGGGRSGRGAPSTDGSRGHAAPQGGSIRQVRTSR